MSGDTDAGVKGVRRHTSRRVARGLLATVVMGFVLLATSFLRFIWPSEDIPRQADAVVVLSGDHGERLPLALELMERGLARTLVFDGTVDRRAEEEWCANGWRGREVICLRPNPDSTRAEARAAGRLARTRGWRRLIVVTATYHVTRTRTLFERCVDGSVVVLGGGQPPTFDRMQMVRSFVHEWLGTVHALTVKRGC